MMFEPSDKPRLFALPPGVDFPAELIKGLDARLGGQSPEALARVQLIVNTRRMERRIREIYDTGPARLLPRLSLVTDTMYRGCTDAVRLVHSPFRSWQPSAHSPHRGRRFRVDPPLCSH